jgi:hypothetical protein
MARRSLVAALAVVALIGAAGCGGSDDDGAAPDQEAEASRCEPVPAPSLAGKDVRPREVGWTLGDSAAVASSDSFGNASPDLAENAWFVSVEVQRPPDRNIVTYLVSDGAFRGRGGTVIQYWEVSGGDDGFTESRECVRMGRLLRRSP